MILFRKICNLELLSYHQRFINNNDVPAEFTNVRCTQIVKALVLVDLVELIHINDPIKIPVICKMYNSGVCDAIHSSTQIVIDKRLRIKIAFTLVYKEIEASTKIPVFT